MQTNVGTCHYVRFSPRTLSGSQPIALVGVYEAPKVLLQRLVVALCLAVRLRVVRGGKPTLCLHYRANFQYRLVKTEPRSGTMPLGGPNLNQTSEYRSSSNSAAVMVGAVSKNLTVFVSLSTTKGDCHRPWLGFHKPIMGGSLRDNADKASVFHRAPPANGRPDRAQQPNAGAVPSVLYRRRPNNAI